MKSNIVIYKGKPSPFDFYKTPQGALKQVISVHFGNDVTIPEVETSTQIYVIDDTLFVFTSKAASFEDGNFIINTDRVTVENDTIEIK